MKKTTKQPERKVFPMTPVLRELKDIFDALEDAKGMAARPVGVFIKRLDHVAIVEVAKAYGIARANFWNKVYSIYPELKGKAISATYSEITLES